MNTVINMAAPNDAELRRVMDEYNARLAKSFKQVMRDREIAVHRAMGAPEAIIERLLPPILRAGPGEDG